ncbi:hypothetical protein ACHQM5_015763 [Ranunculus cassubicifolius]
MKKKKQNSTSQASDLKSLIQQHSEFLDNLVELIPARFYLPVDDNEKPWFQGLSKVAKASAKKESRENIKKAKKARLDPEQSSTTLDLVKKNLEKDDVEEVEEGKKEKSNMSVTYEELRERLHKKLEEFRLKRNAAEGVEKPKPRNEKRNERNERRKEIWEGKRKREGEEIGEEKVIEAEKIDEDVEKATERLAFSHVKIGSEDELGRKKKKKKLSKVQALEEAKKLQEVKKDPEQGKKLSWKAAQDRASGVKVHDDPKLIKESIKKEKKKHEKNVEKWKERLESRDKVRAEKQQKRSGNIAERIHDKKMRKIAKREKKLMRPGFEGRKEGFITKS